MLTAFRPDRLLIVGAIAGVLGILWGLVRPAVEATEGGIQSRWAAQVNEKPIPLDKYWGALARLTSEDRGPAPDAQLRSKILNQMIHEELLLDQAVALGLPSREPIVRRRLIESVGKSVVENAEGMEPDEATLRAFYKKFPEQFGISDRFEAALLYYRGLDKVTKKRAEDAHQRWSLGEPIDRIAANADRPMASPPAGALSEAALRRYVGPTLALSISRLAPGEITAPVKAGGGWWIAKLNKRRKAPQPAFESIRENVLSQWRRQREKEVLKAYVERLARWANVRINKSILDPDTPIPTEFLEAALGTK